MPLSSYSRQPASDSNGTTLGEQTVDAVELRTLDGPNLFMLRPAIKVELAASDDESSRLPAAVASELDVMGTGPMDGELGPLAIARHLAAVIAWLSRKTGLAIEEIVVRELEEPGHVAVAFPWERRRASKALGHLAWKLVAGEQEDVDSGIGEIQSLLAESPDPDDLPEMLPEVDRTTPTIGITGTNGKTTTTRLVASILRNAGGKVGWTSSAGVVVDDEVVLPGDYTGPSGAARVFEEPGIDYAVLETARGGILLRGLGYEHNDVSVMTNISADHMGMHGVHSLDVLTEVKAVVARVTLPDGFAVLNADDSRVLGVRDVVRARPFLFSRHAEHPEVREHVRDGGWALVVRDTDIIWHHDGAEERLTALNDVPITFGGRAEHMVENALAAAAACLAIGLDPAMVKDGLAQFRNRAEQNRGRLNVYDLDGATVVIDFAHNEAGLKHLLTFGRSFCGADGTLYSVVGTAGDREDAAITGIARIAAELADGVIIKDTEKYLRGRDSGDMPSLMRQAVGEVIVAETPNERSGFQEGIARLSPGDVLTVMCIEDYDAILEYLDEHGRSLS